MSDGIFHYFDSRLSIVSDNIASNVWLTVRAINNDAIESALLNFIPPNERHRSCSVVVTHNLNAILV